MPIRAMDRDPAYNPKSLIQTVEFAVGILPEGVNDPDDISEIIHARQETCSRNVQSCEPPRLDSVGDASFGDLCYQWRVRKTRSAAAEESVAANAG